MLGTAEGDSETLPSRLASSNINALAEQSNRTITLAGRVDLRNAAHRYLVTGSVVEEKVQIATKTAEFHLKPANEVLSIYKSDSVPPAFLSCGEILHGGENFLLDKDGNSE